MTIWKKMCPQLAPSTRAASSRLLGIPRKNWVNRNMARPLEMLGRIRAVRLFTSPISLIREYRGRAMESVGTMKETMKMANRAFFHLKSKKAKA